MSWRVSSVIVATLTVALACALAQAVNIETVPVGNPGNAPDTRYAAHGSPYWGNGVGFGAVNYTYLIAKYEVTAGQYCEFLNAVAKTDTYGLYNPKMANPNPTVPANDGYGCNIQRSGQTGSYTYSVASDWANRPVNLVSYWDSCRFANWLHNGQPAGPQGSGTTETGTYSLNGYNGTDSSTIHRSPGSKWAIATEDEWYKAAYHKNDGASGNYWLYPTISDVSPGRDVNDASGNNANHATTSPPISLDGPYYRTVTGAFQGSESPYGTFDQGGNVWEWTDTIAAQESSLSYAVDRGGSFYYRENNMRASYRGGLRVLHEGLDLGFRVVQIPEPATLGLMIAGPAFLRGKRS